MRPFFFLSLAFLTSLSARGQGDFVNFETPSVHPLDLSPDGSRLAIANTAAGRVEIFALNGTATPAVQSSISAGIDPASVRWRTSTELWVTNHVSDSVSVIDVAAGQVIATLATDDEPCDVIFAGSPARAFVSCSAANTVLVFNPADLAAAPQRIPILGEDPRALAVSPDGQTVYAAIFESGNGSTILGGGANGTTISFPPNAVSDPRGPYGGVNPPPNSGNTFSPPLNPAAGPPPPVGLIVRKNAAGAWMDDNARDWTPLVSGPFSAASGRPPGWDVTDNDVAIIRASDLAVSYATRIMNLCMALAVNPATGRVTVVGTDATNQIRFEPVINGRFARVNLGRFEASSPSSVTVADLNPHLTYASPTAPQGERDKSIGDPRAIVWNSAGTRGYVAGMGSDNLIVLNADGSRARPLPIPVGGGPAGLAIDPARGRLYVYNRFGSSLSVVDTGSDLETARVAFFDPTPAAIREGRPFLYDTRRTSGLGHVSCATCHADARMDRLAWDLGDPSGSIKAVDPARHNIGSNLPPASLGFTDFHPMKGPMTTQTLQDIIGQEPHHWRGDRDGLEEFNGAFMSLLGDDTLLTPGEMQKFEDFLATIHFPPNPFRNLDNTLPDSLPLTGHYTSGLFAAAGQPLPAGNAKRALDTIYRPLSRRIDSASLACVSCHNLPSGMGSNALPTATGIFNPIPPGPNGEAHHLLASTDGSSQRTLKVAQLRNLYDKVGFEMTQPVSRSGFGFLHDGSVDSLSRFMSQGIFTTISDQEVADLVALMLSFSGSDFGAPVDAFERAGTASKDAHAATGRQACLTGPASPSAASQLLDQLVALAEAGRIDLVAHSAEGGAARGWYLANGLWRRDQASLRDTRAALLARATASAPVTFTAVPRGSGRRIGVDRDRDGLFDFDEVRPMPGGRANPFRPDATDSAGNNGLLTADGIPDGVNDFDSDGILNQDEMEAGTDPTDPLSFDLPLKLTIAKGAASGTFTLTWQCLPLTTYQISWSPDLVIWYAISTGTVTSPGSGSQMSWTDSGLPATPSAPGSVGKRFYKVLRVK